MTFLTFLFTVFGGLLLVDGQYYVQSPCPDIFQYVNNGGDIYGLIRIDYFGSANSISIKMSFTISTMLYSNYVGSIEPLGSESQLLEEYNRGNAINYRVNFPVTSPLPRLTLLTVNGNQICYGQGDVPRPNEYVTTVTLEHVLYYKSGGNVVYRPNTPKPERPTTPPPYVNQVYVDSQDIDAIFSQPTTTSKPHHRPPVETDPYWERPSPPRWEPPPRGPPPSWDRPPPHGHGPPPRWEDRPEWDYPPPPDRPPPRYPRPRPQQSPEDSPPEYEEDQTPAPPKKKPAKKPTTIRPIDESQASLNSCGVNGLDSVPLIYQGISYERGKWPWLVALFKRKYTGLSYICAGTLISNMHVVTAAHCMQRKNTYTASKDIVVRIGVYDLDDWSDETVLARNVGKADIHESYNSSTLANDILVLTLDRKVEYSVYIKAACLWSGNTDLNAIVESSGVVAGWGASEAGPAGRGEPRMVRMPIVSTTTCRASKVDFHKLTSSKTLCAGDRNGVGPCLGDSGGGLYILDSNTGRWRLRGIVSISLWSQSGEDTCNLNDYIVFTDTAQYLPWIKGRMSS